MTSVWLFFIVPLSKFSQEFNLATWDFLTLKVKVILKFKILAIHNLTFLGCENKKISSR